MPGSAIDEDRIDVRIAIDHIPLATQKSDQAIIFVLHARTAIREGLDAHDFWLRASKVEMFQHLDLHAFNIKGQKIRRCVLEVLTEDCIDGFDRYPRHTLDAATLFPAKPIGLVGRCGAQGVLRHDVQIYASLAHAGHSDIENAIARPATADGAGELRIRLNTAAGRSPQIERICVAHLARVEGTDIQISRYADPHSLECEIRDSVLTALRKTQRPFTCCHSFAPERRQPVH